MLCTELTFQKLTVGKIYAGLLIAENWKAAKTGIKPKGVSVVICVLELMLDAWGTRVAEPCTNVTVCSRAEY